MKPPFLDDLENSIIIEEKQKDLKNTAQDKNLEDDITNKKDQNKQEVASAFCFHESNLLQIRTLLLNQNSLIEDKKLVTFKKASIKEVSNYLKLLATQDLNQSFRKDFLRKSNACIYKKNINILFPVKFEEAQQAHSTLTTVNERSKIENFIELNVKVHGSCEVYSIQSAISLNLILNN